MHKKFLDILQNKNSTQYMQFLQCLRDAHLEHVAQKIETHRGTYQIMCIKISFLLRLQQMVCASHTPNPLTPLCQHMLTSHLLFNTIYNCQNSIFISFKFNIRHHHNPESGMRRCAVWPHSTVPLQLDGYIRTHQRSEPCVTHPTTRSPPRWG